MSPNPADDVRLGCVLADAADEITAARFRASDLRVTRKPDRTPVTDADLAAEDRIRAVVAAERSRDTVVGEERGGTVRRSGRCWLVDPIDGTKNYSRGVPVWATLIALLVDGVPTVGVISAPALGRRWWAARGAGAWATDADGTRRISVSQVAELPDAYVSTTHLGSWNTHHSRAAYLALTDACWENRAFGDFWQHCLVAEGAIDLAAEPVVSAWDIAALAVLVTEAGGRFTDLAGQPRFDGGSALASNALLHDAALAVLAGERSAAR